MKSPRALWTSTPFSRVAPRRSGTGPLSLLADPRFRGLDGESFSRQENPRKKVETEILGVMPTCHSHVCSRLRSLELAVKGYGSTEPCIISVWLALYHWLRIICCHGWLGIVRGTFQFFFYFLCSIPGLLFYIYTIVTATIRYPLHLSPPYTCSIPLSVLCH